MSLFAIARDHGAIFPTQVAAIIQKSVDRGADPCDVLARLAAERPDLFHVAMPRAPNGKQRAHERHRVKGLADRVAKLNERAEKIL